MHKSKSSATISANASARASVKKIPNNSTKNSNLNSNKTDSKIIYNSNQLNIKENSKVNEAKIKSPKESNALDYVTSSSLKKNSLGKINPSPRNSSILSKSNITQSNIRKNTYANSYSNINKNKTKPKPNEDTETEIINLPKGKNIKNPNEKNVNNKDNDILNLNDLEFTFKPPEIESTNVANSTRHNKNSSIKLEGDIYEINNTEIDQVNRNSFINKEKKGKKIIINFYLLNFFQN
jgi:hypothetical protein